MGDAVVNVLPATMFVAVGLLQSILARYDQSIAEWLAKSKSMEEVMRGYGEHTTLPNPEEFGLGPRPQP